MRFKTRRPNRLCLDRAHLCRALSRHPREMDIRRPRIVPIVIAFAAWASACSPVLEMTRPSPTDLSQFQTGAARDSVIEQLGPPLATNAQADGTSCDTYQLYTKGYGVAGKVPVALVETAADVFTVGLAEVVLTPAEGVTRNETHPVTFCYRDGKLSSVASG